MDTLGRLADAAPHARLLGNGRYATLLTGAGTGFSTWTGLALTGWAGDRIEDADGLFVYLRDLDRGTTWSVGHQPVRRPADRYRARGAPGRVAIARLDDGIETVLDAAVAPDADVEIRRLRLRNRSRRRRRVEVTSYAEVVLGDRFAHASHPAFSKLFIETEAAGDGVLLARRRPRSTTERHAWLVHALAGPGRAQHETDRARFLGRGRTTAAPRALGARLSGATGSVLDPIVSLRRTVVLAPGAEADLVVVLGAADGRDAALALAAAHASPAAVEAVLAAAAHADAELLARLGLDDAGAAAVHELIGALLYRHPAFRPPRGAALRARGRDPAALDAHGVSIWRPFVVVDAGAPGVDAKRVAAAVAYARAKGIALDAVVLGDTAVAGDGVVVRRREDLPPADVDLLLARANGLVAGPPGAGDGAPARASRAVAAPLVPKAVRSRGRRERLALVNGYGGFTPDGSEYVLRVGPRAGLPPMPWTNVIANPRFGFLVSERGAACTWSRNSRENRLTPWYNDPVADPHGEALWIRAEDRRVFWSPVPGPAASGDVEVRHGFGYSRWSATVDGLAHEVTMFVPRDEPVKAVRVRLENRGRRARRLSLFSFARLVLGVDPGVGAIATELDATSGALVAENALADDFADGVAFAAVVAPAGARVRHTGDRAAFVGRNGSLAAPAGVAGATVLDGRTGAGLDPCAAFQVSLRVASGASAECTFLLGEETDRDAVRALVARWRAGGAVERALDDVRAFWRDTLSAVRVATPSPGLDVMVNGWLGYQDLACRLWGRSAFYQSGGAFGFRDQLQDAAALLHARPDLTRAQIVLHAGHQFVEGDVLHWWHPPRDRGTRTRFSDDLVWLPYVTARYVCATGDRSVLDERAGFLAARALAPGEDETYLQPSAAGESADVYEHCCRALDRALTRGPHGLPLMGTGDWNDGMNRVGREGRGESVWLAFFLHFVLGEFLPLCEWRADAERVRRYREYRAALRRAIDDAAWDGAWYRRAYYDDGTPLGSAASDECRIDALAQAWAVISGAAPHARAAQAMDAVEDQLVDDGAAIVRLLWPPFDRTAQDPGYIKGYVPGIRENGGQYTHAALWVVRALAELGRRDRAVRVLEMLLPTTHARSRDAVAVYQVEPYVVAADVYGAPPHVGRGGWTWYTGSAGWMYRVALESILGVTVEEGRVLRIRPCIPRAWPGFTVALRLPDGRTRYDVAVDSRRGGAGAVVEATLDDARAPVEDGAARVPLRRDGAVHRVRVTLG